MGNGLFTDYLPINMVNRLSSCGLGPVDCQQLLLDFGGLNGI